MSVANTRLLASDEESALGDEAGERARGERPGAGLLELPLARVDRHLPRRPVDHVHPTALGHAMIAQELLKLLAPPDSAPSATTDAE